MTHLTIQEAKTNFLNLLHTYPFDTQEEATRLGVPNGIVLPRDESTALETPYTFRRVPLVKVVDVEKTVYEETYSTEESTEGEVFYAEEIRMNIELFAHGQLIVEDSTVTLHRNRKYGLVGRNGIGKSTLLRAIRKRSFGLPKGLKIHLLRQDYVSDERVIDYVGADAGKTLQSLGFRKEQMEATIRSLSGGWRMRAQLARALHLNADLLLLDEPTNFLDMKAISFLEGEMKNLKTVIVVSHDRRFLDNTVDEVLHLDDFKIRAYRGTYSQFVSQQQDEREAQRRDYESVKAQREHIQSFIDKFRYNAKRSSQAQSRIKLLEKLPLPDPPKEDPRMRFRFGSTEAKGVLLEAEGVSYAYSSRGGGDKSSDQRPNVLENLSLKIQHNSRIVIVGDNGTGKSTLLKLLAGDAPSRGSVAKHPALRVGYFAQHHVDHLDHSTGALSLLMQRHGEEPSRAALSGFGLHVNNQKISTLSGGQKSKLAFAMISLERPNLLVMDEPTNHLDMETIEALADALVEFKGAVVCVSHDLAFVERVFNEVYICQGGGLTYFKGTAGEYKEGLLAKSDEKRR